VRGSCETKLWAQTRTALAAAATRARSRPTQLFAASRTRRSASQQSQQPQHSRTGQPAPWRRHGLVTFPAYDADDARRCGWAVDRANACTQAFETWARADRLWSEGLLAYAADPSATASYESHRPVPEQAR
jgi:hypothetical protein